MANNDRVTRAIDNLIDALNELKGALAEQQDSYVPDMEVSNTPPIDLTPVSEVGNPDYQPQVTISNEPPVDVVPLVSFFDDTEDEPERPSISSTTIPLNEQESAVSQARRFCGNCGNELNPGAKFCPSCGNPV